MGGGYLEFCRRARARQGKITDIRQLREVARATSGTGGNRRPLRKSARAILRNY